MPSIEWNKKLWNDDFPWPKNGDEWDNQAGFCNQPYEKWKNSIAENFILNNINEESVVLEIAPGHGRWTEFILKKVKKIILVELSQERIKYCKKIFDNSKNIDYFMNNGKDLFFIADNSIDFIFSYDSFVHIEKDAIACYFKEFSRILKKEGIAIIHHAGRNDLFLKFKFIKNFGDSGKKIYNYLTIKKYDNIAGHRADVSKEGIKKAAEKYNLKVIFQINYWGENKEFNNKLFNDYITKMQK